MIRSQKSEVKNHKLGRCLNLRVFVCSLKCQTSEKGFTFIEMIVGIFIFAIIAIGLFALISNMFTTSNKQSNLLADVDQARKLTGTIVGQLRNARTSATGAYVLDTVSDQALTFYSDTDNDGLADKVRYYVLSGKLNKAITKPTGNPLIYNSANEIVSTVQNNIANSASPVFYYYNDSYDGTASSTPLTQPVNVTAVRFIKIELKIYNKAGITGTNTYTVTSAAALRNLKDNLGEGENTLIQYNLTTAVLPAGTGSVATSPVGPTYNGNTLVNINAYPNLGYGFSSWTGNVALPSSQATTIIMNNNETVTANFVTIPQTLTGSITNKSGPDSSRVWTLRINNTNSFAVNNVNLYSLALTQTAGTACSHSVTAPAAFPALVGNISASSNRTYLVTINFSGCASSARFTANFTFAGNNLAQWGSANITNQQK